MSESMERGTDEQSGHMETMTVDMTVDPKCNQGSDMMTTVDMDDFFDEGKRDHDGVHNCSNENHPLTEEVVNGSEIKETSNGGEENENRTSQSPTNEDKKRTKLMSRKRKYSYGDCSSPVDTQMLPRRSARLKEKQLRMVHYSRWPPE